MSDVIGDVISKPCRLVIWGEDDQAIYIANALIDKISTTYSYQNGYTSVVIELRTDKTIQKQGKPEKLD